MTFLKSPQATENSTSHSEFSRGKLTSTNSEPGPNGISSASIAKRLAFFRSAVNSIDDEGIDDFCIDNHENGKPNSHSSSDTEGEDMISEVQEEQHKNENVKCGGATSLNSTVVDENDTKHICYK